MTTSPPVAAAAEPETGTDSVPVVERTAPSSSTVTTPVVSSGSELTPTEIYEPGYIDRGYEHIEDKLRSLGADIRREPIL